MNENLKNDEVFQIILKVTGLLQKNNTVETEGTTFL